MRCTNNYNWSGLEFPVAINKVNEFKKNNNDIVVNVLIVKGQRIYICKNSKHYDRKNVVNLLLITDSERRHYTAIKTLSRLLGSSNSKHKCKQHFCLNCLQGFSLEESRDNHFEYCKDNESVRIEMLKEGSLVAFHDGQNKFKVPFSMYADFESIFKPIKETSPNLEESYTKEINQYVPSGFCVYSKFSYGEVENPLKLYRGEDCVEEFCDYVKNEANRLYHMFPEKPMNHLTHEEWRKFNQGRKCHKRFKGFEQDNPKVRDHCHETGQYRGPAHRNCNLRYKIPSYIPIFFHNLSRYDAHLFIRELGKKFDKGKMGVIAENKEKYITFNVNVMVDRYGDELGKIKEKKIQLRFIDSMRFMASSLDSLTKNLAGVSGMPCNECGESCKITHIDENYIAHGKCKKCYLEYNKRQLNKYYTFYNFDNLRVGHNDEQFRLLLRKGVYPYEYKTSWDKFKETKLPPKEAFHSNLNMSDISEYDYKYAQKVWKEFNLKNLEEYHDLYLTTDMLLASNVFEAFRDDCMNTYKLDPAHFYTSTELFWQASLKFIVVRLELLTHPDMLFMFERGIRGGITQAVHRYASANNKYMGDPEGVSSFLQYLDANNLYGWAMSQPLPTGGLSGLTI